MSKKLLILFSILLVFTWTLTAGTIKGMNVDKSNRVTQENIKNAQWEVIGLNGQSARYPNYNRGYNRDTADTLIHAPAYGDLFQSSPGDAMIVVYQIPADGYLKGVNIPVNDWGTGDQQLTVSLHLSSGSASSTADPTNWDITNESYPLRVDGTTYPASAVNGAGWIGGYDMDASTGVMSIEGTSYSAGGTQGVCDDGDFVVSGSQDPLGTELATSGPPRTPKMGLLWPDGYTTATMDPTNFPEGQDNWIRTADYGTEPFVKAGSWVAILVNVTGAGGGDTERNLFYITNGDLLGMSNPYVGMKFYGSATPCNGTSGNDGWHIRNWIFDFELAVLLTGDRGPVFEDIVKLTTTLSTDPIDVWADITEDNPSGGDAGVVSVSLLYQLDSLTNPTINTIAMDLTDGTDLDGTWNSQIPGQAPGTTIYWSVVAVDVGGNQTARPTLSYFIFANTAGNDLIFNNQNMLYGTLVYSSYLYFYWGGEPFDIWDATYGAITEELVVNYTTIVEEAGKGGPVYTDEVDAIIGSWWSGDKTYIAQGDEWLGGRYGWAEDMAIPAGDIALDILGVAHYYPDINGTAAGISRLKPVAGDPVTGDLVTFLSDSSVMLNYDPNYETSTDNWLDGVDAVDGYTVGMTAFAGILDSAAAVDPTTDVYDVMVYGQQGNGGKSAFLAFDAISLNTAPDYFWIGAHDYSGELLSPLGTVYEYLGTILNIDDEVGIPNKFTLKGNYPNPFNPTTNIAFNLDVRSDVTVTVYSLLGEEVATIHNSVMQPGLQNVKWNGFDKQGVQVASGVYLYRVEAQNRALTGKMMLLK